MSTLNNSFGVSFYLKRQRTSQRGTCPIYARISVNGKRVEISVKRSIEPVFWNAVRGMAKGTREETRKLNKFLEQFRAGIVECYQEMLLSRKLITAEMLKARVTGAENSEYTLCRLMDEHNREQEHVLEWGTLKNYFTTQKYVLAFLRERYKTKDIYLSELGYKFISDFEQFLRSRKNHHGKPSMGNNGVMKHLERLRKMVNLAVRLEWLPRNPFTAHQLKFQKVERQFLTAEELRLIEERDFPIERIQMVKDLFIFSCYTGLAYIDVSNLTPASIVTGPDGDRWISTSRKKTRIPVKVPLLLKALAIIEKYRNHPKALADGTLLPVFSNQKLNSYLQEVADRCGINKPLTFHIARHTFATTVTLSNGVPIESVSKMLGHTKLTTTQIYAKVIESKLSEDMARLREKLEG